MIMLEQSGGMGVEDRMMMVRLPARFLSVGQCVAHEGWVHPDRTLDSSVLIVVDQGRFGITIGTQSFVLDGRQALLLPAGTKHAGFHAQNEMPPVYYWVHFESGRVNVGDAISFEISAIDLSEITHNRLVTCFHQLINESSTNKNGGILCDYMLSVLLLEMHKEGREMPRTAVANRMLEYIRLHCCERLSLSDLSRTLGYSEDYLSRLFHEYADCSFRQYIHRLRMKRAIRELLSSSKPIQEIAVECGYSNAKFFSTVFSKSEGISPSAYRNMYGGIHQNNA